VAVIVSLVLDIRTITLVLSPTLANPYCLLSLPLLRLAMDGVALRAEGTSSKRAALTPVVLVLICVVTLYQTYMTGYSTFSVLFG
jgi:hypothetical protein